MKLFTVFLFTLFLMACGSDNDVSNSGQSSQSQVAPPSQHMVEIDDSLYEILGSKNGHYMILVDTSLATDKNTLFTIGSKVCADETVCVGMFWIDRTRAASDLPISSEQANAKIAHYNYNRNTGANNLLTCENGQCN